MGTMDGGFEKVARSALLRAAPRGPLRSLASAGRMHASSG